MAKITFNLAMTSEPCEVMTSYLACIVSISDPFNNTRDNSLEILSMTFILKILVLNKNCYLCHDFLKIENLHLIYM